MLERALVLEDQLARDLVVLAQHAHHLLGLRDLGEGGEAAQVEEHHGDLAAMALQRIVGAAADDQLGQLRREEAAQPPDPLELGDLRRHALLERGVPLLDFVGQRLDRVVQALDAQHRAHARGERRMVDRLGQVLVAAGLEPGDHVLRVGHRGDHDDRRERERGVGAQPPADLDAVELGHHDVEQDQVGLSRRAAASPSSPSAAVTTS